MQRAPISLIPLCALLLSPADASASSPPSPAPTPPAADSAPASPGGGHSYDPCEMVSQQDVASAAGVATNQVFAAKSPTRNECVWAIGNKLGAPGQQVALTVQTIGQVKQAHGFAKLAAVVSALQSVPGVPLMQNPAVTRAFADATIVANLGDRASWKNGSLSVLKNELLFQVGVSGQPSDAESLKVAKSVAKSALAHLQTQ